MEDALSHSDRQDYVSNIDNRDQVASNHVSNNIKSPLVKDADFGKHHKITIESRFRSHEPIENDSFTLSEAELSIMEHHTTITAANDEILADSQTIPLEEGTDAVTVSSLSSVTNPVPVFGDDNAMSTPSSNPDNSTDTTTIFTEDPTSELHFTYNDDIWLNDDRHERPVNQMASTFISESSEATEQPEATEPAVTEPSATEITMLFPTTIDNFHDFVLNENKNDNQQMDRQNHETQQDTTEPCMIYVFTESAPSNHGGQDSITKINEQRDDSINVTDLPEVQDITTLSPVSDIDAVDDSIDSTTFLSVLAIDSITNDGTFSTSTTTTDSSLAWTENLFKELDFDGDFESIFHQIDFLKQVDFTTNVAQDQTNHIQSQSNHSTDPFMGSQIGSASGDWHGTATEISLSVQKSTASLISNDPTDNQSTTEEIRHLTDVDLSLDSAVTEQADASADLNVPTSESDDSQSEAPEILNDLNQQDTSEVDPEQIFHHLFVENLEDKEQFSDQPPHANPDPLIEVANVDENKHADGEDINESNVETENSDPVIMVVDLDDEKQHANAQHANQIGTQAVNYDLVVDEITQDDSKPSGNQEPSAENNPVTIDLINEDDNSDKNPDPLVAIINQNNDKKQAIEHLADHDSIIDIINQDDEEQQNNPADANLDNTDFLIEIINQDDEMHQSNPHEANLDSLDPIIEVIKHGDEGQKNNSQLASLNNHDPLIGVDNQDDEEQQNNPQNANLDNFSSVIEIINHDNEKPQAIQQDDHLVDIDSITDNQDDDKQHNSHEQENADSVSEIISQDEEKQQSNLQDATNPDPLPEIINQDDNTKPVNLAAGSTVPNNNDKVDSVQVAPVKDSGDKLPSKDSNLINRIKNIVTNPKETPLFKKTSGLILSVFRRPRIDPFSEMQVPDLSQGHDPEQDFIFQEFFQPEDSAGLTTTIHTNQHHGNDKDLSFQAIPFEQDDRSQLRPGIAISEPIPIASFIRNRNAVLQNPLSDPILRFIDSQPLPIRHALTRRKRQLIKSLTECDLHVKV